MGDKLGVIARVHRTVRWIKRGFGYAGSNQTSDLGGMVFAKLARNEETRELLARDPDKLQGLVKTITRQALIGALRKRPREALPAEPTARLERVEDELDPALQREIARRQQLRLVRDELDRFLAGEGSENFRAQSRPKMVAAFELFYFCDQSQPDVAARLGVSRNTVMVWIDCMTLHIARRIAERGASH